MTFLIFILIAGAVFNYRTIRRYLITNSRVVIAVAFLFAVGYLVGWSFYRILGPAWLMPIGGIVFVIMGLRELIGYMEDIREHARRR